MSSTAEEIIRRVVAEEIAKIPKAEVHHLGECNDCTKSFLESVKKDLTVNVPEPKVELLHHSLKTMQECPNCKGELDSYVEEQVRLRMPTIIPRTETTTAVLAEPRSKKGVVFEFGRQ